MTMRGSTTFLHIPAWVVMADAYTSDPAPGSHRVFRKLGIVINALTGRYEFGFVADPYQMS